MSRLQHRRFSKFHLVDKIKLLILRLIPIALIVAFVWAQSNLLITQYYLFAISDLPKSHIGYKIMHLSDISSRCGDVVRVARVEKPDVILLTGGYTDSNGRSNEAVSIVQKLASIAPTYYILNADDNGNDPLSGTGAISIVDNRVETSQIYNNANDLLTFCQHNNLYTSTYVNELMNEDSNIKASRENGTDEGKYSTIEKIDQSIQNNESIYICGLGMYSKDTLKDARTKTFELIGTDPNKFTIMLNGNIDLIDELCKYTDTDVIMFGGTYGTNRLSDKYTKGMYANKSTQLIVTGGAGNSSEYKRILNFPEVQIIVLSDGTLSDKNPLEKFIYTFLPDVGTIFDNDGGIKKVRLDGDNLLNR